MIPPMSSSPEPSIPEGARAVFDRTDEYGYGYYHWLRDGQVVRYHVLNPEGSLDREGELRDDTRHGFARRYYDDGKHMSETLYVDGFEHGVAKQWSHDGAFLGTYRMDHGTGVDLWRDSDGSLLEERHLQDSHRHGFERWWNSDNRTVWDESHFKWSVEHGIFRKWNSRGRLRRGFPQYYVDGKRVTKRQYLRDCKADPSLPPFRPEENRPERGLPREYLEPEA